MTTPNASICMPMFNASRYLRECIDSILARLTREGVSIASIRLRSSFPLKPASFMPENCSKNRGVEKPILMHIDNQ